MTKIHSVIDDCKDCSFCVIAKSPVNNFETFAICNNENNPFLIAAATHNLNAYDIIIPKNCPLEDYIEKDNESNA